MAVSPQPSDPAPELDPSMETAAGPMTAPAPAAPARPRRALLWVGVVVVVVLVLIAALYVAGVGPFARSSSSGSSGVSFTSAEASANQTTNGLGTGPWKILFAAGADPTTGTLQSTTIPADIFGNHPGCTGAAVSGAPGAVGFPAFDGNYSSGDAPVWFFAFVNVSGSIIFTLVLNGQATAFEDVSGPGCQPLAAVGTLPGTIVGSSTAVNAALVGGGYAVLLAHPGGNLVFAAAAITGGGAWSVEYTTCPTEGPGVAGTVYYGFNASVGLQSGALIGPVQSGPQSCAGLNLLGGVTGG